MKKIKIGDIVVISVILLMTAGVFCFRLFQFEDGDTVSVSVDGEVSIYSLDENRIVNIESGGITLSVVIEDGEAYVTESDCPEQSCVQMGRISKKGELIACVPAKLYVKITGEGDGVYDYIIG